MWILTLFVGILFVTFIIAIIFFRAFKNKEHGKVLLKDSEKTQKAPEFFYSKQRLFRYYYTLFQGIDFLLIVFMTVFSIITIYMVIDNNPDINIRIFCSAASAISAMLKATIRPDKIAQGYIIGVRILENAIIKYELCDNADLCFLISANQEAESKIEGKFC